MSDKTNVSVNVSTLFENVSALIERSRRVVATAINTGEVYTKFFIGKYIVDFEQNGERRAQYGKQVIKELSDRLTEKFGSGWSYPNLKNIRQFYLIYSNRRIGNYSNGLEKANRRLAISEICEKIDLEPYEGMDNTQGFKLSWSHYQILIGCSLPSLARTLLEYYGIILSPVETKFK